MSAELVEVIRSGFREGVHRGSVLLLTASGAVHRARGAVRTPVFPRSSNKPIQALGMLRSGLELADDADLALVCASHNGEPEHVRRALAILAAHGLSEADFRCPPALPMYEPATHAAVAAGEPHRAAFMNCSGKHAGMLATCVANGWPVEDYVHPAHPLQLAIADTLAELAGEPVAATGVDGCGAPLYAISLTGLARCYTRLVTAAPGSQQRRVADAMRANPFLVAGTGREDTRLMRTVPGLLCKGGAEGVLAAALPDGRAVTMKIDDGAGRARLPVLVAALGLFGVNGPDLAELAEQPVWGGGRVVGSARLICGALDVVDPDVR